jgi:hypothetical protein
LDANLIYFESFRLILISYGLSAKRILGGEHILRYRPFLAPRYAGDWSFEIKR